VKSARREKCQENCILIYDTVEIFMGRDIWRELLGVVFFEEIRSF
jgi:hypothetical protein